MRYAAAFILLGTMLFAEEAQKPACSAKTLGQFWPEDANVSRDAARQFYQSGELEMCSMVVWKYKWKHISVNVRDLGKGKRPAAAETKRAGGEVSNLPLR
ncbi:MAG TPA: hypothetical protein VEU96_05520 [Bryobacteraceae bacterium]|nr:hypothetical protein [Bryobacteraceae bacterium]